MSDQPHLPKGPGPQTTIDQLKLQHLMDQLRTEQNLAMGVFGGLFAALVAASAWATITYYTGWQSGIVAVGLGWLVGYAVRRMGNGIDLVFGVAGAVLALLGIVFGNLLATCAYLAENSGASILEVIATLDLDTAARILVEGFSPVDLLFYALAVYYAYKGSIRPMTESELQQITRPV